ncbi:MAG: transglutaminase family protein [Planctomycetota bacterium]
MKTTDFLSACDVVDRDEPSVIECARSLVGRSINATAENCFHFVRDRIAHSADAESGPVTLSASSVLKHGTGYCYAKSHLLAALLRANKIPAALCYQRLTIEDESGPFCLHGLNAVYLDEIGWYRIDARGNRPGIAAQFCPPVEALAFPLEHDGEKDLSGFYARPIPAVTTLLGTCSSWDEVLRQLPTTDPDTSIP